MPIRLWTSPRSTGWVELAGKTTLHFESDPERVESLRKHLRRVAMLDAPAALPLVHDTIETSGAYEGKVLTAHFATARRRADRTMPVARAASFVAQLADLVRAHHEGGGEGVLGAFDPSLVVETDEGDRLIAPGLVRIGQANDSGIRGMRGGGRLAHQRITHDQLRASPALPDEVTSLAVLSIELVAGREPYPTDSEFTYMTAVTKGAHLPLETLVPSVSSALRRTLERALLVDASARPTLEALKSALLAEPGVSERAAPAQRDPEDAGPKKPWWRRF